MSRGFISSAILILGLTSCGQATCSSSGNYDEAVSGDGWVFAMAAAGETAHKTGAGATRGMNAKGDSSGGSPMGQATAAGLEAATLSTREPADEAAEAQEALLPLKSLELVGSSTTTSRFHAKRKSKYSPE